MIILSFNSPLLDLSVVSNDGIPSAVYYTPPVTCTSPNSDATAILCDPPHRVRRSSSIGGLSDDALDLFPPTEQDEEEIREVEEYVEMLAWLEMLEETHGKFPEWGQLHKRWEERRKEKVREGCVLGDPPQDPSPPSSPHPTPPHPTPPPPGRPPPRVQRAHEGTPCLWVLLPSRYRHHPRPLHAPKGPVRQGGAEEEPWEGREEEEEWKAICEQEQGLPAHEVGPAHGWEPQENF